MGYAHCEEGFLPYSVIATTLIRAKAEIYRSSDQGNGSFKFAASHHVIEMAVSVGSNSTCR